MILIIAILLIDQFIKIWVKTHMELHESIRVTNWFYIAFIENNGMAYGMQIGSKLLLSLFRVVAIGALGYYIWLQSKKTNVRWGYIVCLSMILAGAAGNLIDCMFYGLCFDASTVGHVSQYVGLGNGYESFLMGRVVDMFYFPLIVTTYPDWFPVCGGEDFIFFSPVFNFADSSISVGVVALLLFFRKEIGQISFRKK
ncbi:signal peptidase II [Prevotella communis]|uniref:Lipoprotein signal peptidase n=1 Tax=Prevotella communis TaxID=2913614 RepID=A0A1H0J677_9BACT|nr:signal peptidase II [Prevotella communis]SDO39013.1 signal peptidase II [Prevotella communis]